jgi:GNAT superfamily N-acetyltransferase
MNIRHAVEADRAAIVAMARHFIAGTRYRDVFQTLGGDAIPLEPGIDRLLTLLWNLGPDSTLVLVAEERSGELAGMIAIIVGIHQITQQVYGEEICWWVEPKHRVGRLGPQLLRDAETWGRSKGLAFLKMIEPVPSDVGRFYRASGYLPIETAYAKVL